MKQAMKPPTNDIIKYKLCKLMGFQLNPAPQHVRRNLFGSADPLKTTDDLRKIEQELVERSRQEWNFDFVKRMPLPAGRYLWDLVNCRDVPSWYSEECKPNVENSPVYSSADDKTTSSKSTDHKRLLQTTLNNYVTVEKRRSSLRLKSKFSSAKNLRSCKTSSPRFLLHTGGTMRSRKKTAW